MLLKHHKSHRHVTNEPLGHRFDFLETGNRLAVPAESSFPYPITLIIYFWFLCGDKIYD